MSNNVMQLELEILVDSYGVKAVLEALAQVCREKADHIRTNWQDQATAEVWEQNADRIDVAAMKVQ
jgi:hypothetical protein